MLSEECVELSVCEEEEANLLVCFGTSSFQHDWHNFVRLCNAHHVLLLFRIKEMVSWDYLKFDYHQLILSLVLPNIKPLWPARVRPKFFLLFFFFWKSLNTSDSSWRESPDNFENLSLAKPLLCFAANPYHAVCLTDSAHACATRILYLSLKETVSWERLMLFSQGNNLFQGMPKSFFLAFFTHYCLIEDMLIGM